MKIVRDDSFSTGEAECFALGSKLEVDDIVFDTGGGGTNAAVSFARQGLHTGYIGKIGAFDARGREILTALRTEGVDVRGVVKDKRRMTGYSVLLLTARGERTVLVYRGASADIAPSDLVGKKLSAQWIYVTSLGGRLDTIRKIWKLAALTGASIAWNPGAGELAHGFDRLRPFIAQVGMLTINQEEAAKLLGYTRHQDIGVFQVLRSHVRGITLLTQGTEGALAGFRQNTWHSGTRQVHVVDTTGAGDAFGSGFIGAYIRTNNIPQAMVFATANAESVIQHIGAKPGLLRTRRAHSAVPITKI